MRLHKKLTLAISLLIFILVGGVVTALLLQVEGISDRMRKISQEQIDTAMTRQAETYAVLFTETVADTLFEPVYATALADIGEFIGPVLARPEVESILVFDRSGRILHDGSGDLRRYGEATSIEAYDAFLRGGETRVRRRGDLIRVTAPIGFASTVLGVLQISYRVDSLDAAVDALGATLDRVDAEGWRRRMLVGVVAALFILVVGVLTATAIARGISRPLARLAAATARVGDGRFERVAQVEAGGEIGELVASFNGMVERLDRTTITNAYLDRILERMPDALLVLDAAGRVTRANPVAETFLGHLPEALRARRACEILRPAADGPAPRPVVDRPPLTETIDVGADGDARRTAYQVLWSPLSDTEVLCVARNVSELEDARLQAESAAQEKSNFLAITSHELRTPLNAIIGFSDMLRRQVYGDLGDRYRGYAEDIHASGEHLLSVINDIIDVAKIESGRITLEKTSLDVVAMLHSLERLHRSIAADRDIAVEFRPPAGSPRLCADERLIRQVLINLIGNALKFTPAGGRVTVSCDAGDELTVSVADTGVGIAARDLGRIREPFVQVENALTRRNDGTGLGLALVDAIVAAHGGRLEIASEEGRGTRVTVSLPGDGVAGAPRRRAGHRHRLAG